MFRAQQNAFDDAVGMYFSFLETYSLHFVWLVANMHSTYSQSDRRELNSRKLGIHTCTS